MKNSQHNGIGNLIRRTASILTILATLAMTNVAKASDFKGTPSNTGANITATNSTILESASSDSQTDAGATHLEANLLNLTQPIALYCVTDYGTYFIQDWQLAGTICAVSVSFYPFVVYGVAE
jgi:hypothetical protein